MDTVELAEAGPSRTLPQRGARTETGTWDDDTWHDDTVNYLYIHDFAEDGKPMGPPRKVVLPVNIGPELRERRAEVAFRWYHCPVNNTALVQDCLEQISGRVQVTSKGGFDQIWRTNTRPAASLPQHILSRHCRFIEPSCEAHDQLLGAQQQSNGAPVSAFLPYLNWELFEYVQVINDRKPAASITDPNRRRAPPGPPTPPLHQRRTLDQFYYTGLRDTASRDAGQTISKWTGTSETETMGMDGWDKAKPNSLVVMVDQLWLWILDRETVFSCFPSAGRQYNGPNLEFTDLYSSVRRGVPVYLDAYGFAALLVTQSITVFFDQENKKFADLLGIYQWAIGNKAARQTDQFEDFGRRSSGPVSSTPSSDDTTALKLSLEVADILDELNMLDAVLVKQGEVMASLLGATTAIRGTTGPAGGFIEDAEKELKRVRDGVARLRADALTTQTMLLNLLDLKQKAASLEEARASTKQGQAVMLFTIVTIIFLPLSFFSSYFGQNVTEITGDDNNPTSADVWKIGGPVSVAVIMFALLVAFYISNPDSRLWVWKRKKTRSVLEEEP